MMLRVMRVENVNNIRRELEAAMGWTIFRTCLHTEVLISGVNYTTGATFIVQLYDNEAETYFKLKYPDAEDVSI